jgi:hypothetical protein
LEQTRGGSSDKRTLDALAAINGGDRGPGKRAQRVGFLLGWPPGLVKRWQAGTVCTDRRDQRPCASEADALQAASLHACSPPLDAAAGFLVLALEQRHRIDCSAAGPR